MSLSAILIAAILLQQPQAASLEGTVVQAGTTQPIARAVVQVTGDKSTAYTMETGVDGKFEFHNLPRGQYQIKVSRTGYMDGVFGQRGPNGRGRSLSVDAGQIVKDVRVTLVPFGAISGRVYDDRGEPLANVNVQALKYSYQEGQVNLQAVKSALTDDRGEYRLFWLPPGEYYVAAIASTAKVHAMLQVVLHEAPAGPITIDGIPPSGQSPSDTYAPVYYPGTPDARAATQTEVRPGADLNGIDFTLVRVIPRKVRGAVVDGSTGQLVKSAFPMLVPRSAAITGAMPARPAGDGTFEIQDAPPGSYLLVARTNLAGRIVGGRVPVEIGNADLDGIVVVLSPGIDLPATIEGLRSSPPAELYPLIALKDQVALPARGTNAQASFKNLREFTIDDVVEGDYRLQITDLPAEMYVKSARFGAVDALNETLHVDSRTTDRLAIVLGTDGGLLEGTVMDRSRNAVANASLALLPVDVNQPRPDLYRKASADESGRFQLSQIAPGDYAVFAWEDVEESVWRDPEFVRRNEAAGRRIHISANSRETVELIAIPFAF